MRRRLLIAAIFLLAGAVVNVAVAWACTWALNGFVGVDTDKTVVPSDELAANLLSSRLGDKVFNELADYSGLVEYGLGWSWMSIGGRYYRPMPDSATLWMHTLGWPMLSMRWEAISLSQSVTPGSRWYRWAWVTPMRWTQHERVVLPLLPIWPGFAVNTVFYAALLAVLFYSPFALRRFIRVRRGLCPACAYPRGQADVCSECGKPLAGRMTVAA